MTALMHAIELEDPLIASILIGQGANVNIADLEGVTALMMAACNGYYEVVL